ncbi:MAG: ROK family protein [Flavobacteriales bacterium]|nr:ROK family protein [Flavobacteriales bacterium]
MIVGVDIGGTTTKIGVVNDGRVTATKRIPTLGDDALGTEPGSAFADAITQTIRSMDASPLNAIGIGVPNGNPFTGSIDRAPNLPWKSDIPLARMLKDRMGVQCALGNDANAAALGEWKYGAGRGTNDLLVVTLGTGLGSGFIIDGRLLLGPHGNAGELGHTIAVMDGRMCTCGRRGCLEAYVSIRGIRQTYLELADSSELLQQEGVKPIADAAQNGDDAAVQAFRDTARWLATALANAVAFSVPERIVLFGGIARNGDVLMNPLCRYFKEALFYIYEGKVELMLSALPEDDAGILGAAALVDP